MDQGRPRPDTAYAASIRNQASNVGGLFLLCLHTHRPPRIIHKLITKEEQYVQDLDIIEDVFVRPLRSANVMPYVEEFIEEVFSNIVDLRDCNRRLLEIMYVRQREEAPIIKTIGDIFLDVATEFKKHYPFYVGRHYLADKRLKEELEANADFRLFIEVRTPLPIYIDLTQ